MSTADGTAGPDGGPACVAVVVARDGRLPAGAADAVQEASGHALVVGSGTAEAARALTTARHVRRCETGPGLRPAALARTLAPVLATTHLVVLPASPDGRDLAPRLAAVLGRPLLARALSAGCHRPSDAAGPTVRAEVTRLDDQVLVPVEVGGPAVVTLVGAGRVGAHPPVPPPPGGAVVDEVVLATPTGGPADPEPLGLLAPDLHTMDLADATRVVAGGAGLAAGADDRRAAATFDLLVGVAAALGGSAGATRVATDAGWTGYERQIGTTGVAVDPDLYVALGISGAAQHTGGLGDPRHVVSVNTDPSCPMTAMADLGLVTDAAALLVEVAHRLGVAVPDGLAGDGAPPPAGGTGRG